MSLLGAWFEQAKRHLRTRDLPSALLAAWATLMVLRVHWPYLVLPSEQSIDEGYLIAIGQRMLHGRMLPFVDGVAHSGPLFLFSGALIAAFGEFSWLPVRVAAVVCFAGVALLGYACGVAAKRPLAGAIAAAAVPCFATLRMAPYDGVAYNAELPGMVLALASLLACLRALEDEQRPPSLGALIVAGLCTALGALSKQIAVLLVLPQVGYVLIALYARADLTARRRAVLLLAYFGAAALPLLALLGHLALGGALRDAYYYVVTYNHAVYMTPFHGVSRVDAYRDWVGASPLELSVTLTALGWGLAQLIAARGSAPSWLRAARMSAFDLTVTLMAVGGVIGARASMRDFGHYYLMVLPGFGLLAGCVIERAAGSFARANTRHAWAARLVLLVPIVLVGEMAWSQRQHHLSAWSTQHMGLVDLPTAHAEPPVCAFIRAHSRPDEPLFVWGFRAQLNVSCGRRPASRFVFNTFNAGFVPQANDPTEVEDTKAVPGSRGLLIAELEASRPPVIVDAARTMGMRSFRRYRELFEYIDRNYDMASVAGGDEVWLRKDRPR